MGVAIRYYTRSGNTKKLAEAIGKRLNIQVETVDKALEEKVDVLFLGCSYYAFDMDPNVKKFLKDNKNNIGKIACFGTSALMKSMKKPMKKVLDEIGTELLEEEFHCHGSFGPMHRGKPDEKDVKAVQDFAEKILKSVKIKETTETTISPQIEIEDTEGAKEAQKKRIEAYAEKFKK